METKRRIPHRPTRVLAAFTMMFLCFVPSAHGAARIIENISNDWRFILGDDAGLESPDYPEGSGFQVVQLPHTWNAQDTFDDVPGYYQGVGWYRKSFELPAAWEGKQISLRFDAACQVAMVWVNGVLVGSHKGAFTPFQFDITRIVHTDRPNLVAVRVDNRWRRDIPPWDMDFNLMGGIERQVWLIANDPAHIVTTDVTTPQVSNSAATVSLETEIRNESKVARSIEAVATIIGPKGKTVARLSCPEKVSPGETVVVKQQTRVANPELWSPSEPNLYHIFFSLKENGKVFDDDQAPLGFRWYHFDPDKGFFLNGQPLKLRGVNRHDDFPGLGWALPASRQRKDMELIKEIGANFVRLAHYAQDPSVLEACDELGLLVWEEVPLDGEGQQLAAYAGATDLAETIQQMLRDTISRDRNHPSIIMWSMGNENLNGATIAEWRAIADLTRQLSSLSKSLDPTRPTAIAINRPDRAGQVGLFDLVDVAGLNIYHGWYTGKFEDFGPIVDDVHRKYPNRPLIISEYGADMERGRHTDHPARYDFSEEWGCLYHESYLDQMSERPYLSGSLLWNVFDFGVEKRTHQSIPHLNQKGIYTYDRQPKDVYYLYQSKWTSKPMVYIVSHTYTERQGDPSEHKTLKVYSNCDQVELFVNGKSLGKKAAPFVWDVTLDRGDNQLRAIGQQGSEEAVDSMVTRF
jgi:beta-galactosidase